MVELLPGLVEENGSFIDTSGIISASFVRERRLPKLAKEIFLLLLFTERFGIVDVEEGSLSAHAFRNLGITGRFLPHLIHSLFGESVFLLLDLDLNISFLSLYVKSIPFSAG